MNRRQSTPANPVTLGSLIRDARLASGQTVDALCAEAGVTRANWYRYEADTQVPSAIMLFQIADALGVTAEDLRPPKG